MGVCVHVSHLTKSGMGTWGLGHGMWDMGTQGREDVGLKDMGRDKQTSPDFCAEFVKYNFRQSSER